MMLSQSARLPRTSRFKKKAFEMPVAEFAELLADQPVVRPLADIAAVFTDKSELLAD